MILVLGAVSLFCAIGNLSPLPATAEQASGVGPVAGRLDAGGLGTCAILGDGSVRCWGNGSDGELGYPSTLTVGATNTPASVGPVDIGAGYAATAISSGDYHTCVIRNDGSVLCWGFGGDGRLGYGNTNNVGDVQTPGSVGPVELGGQAAKAITAGGGHTCAILDDGTVRCWGFGGDGELGYGNHDSVDSPASVGPVDLGTGRTAVAISAGYRHTCAILDNGQVECWGYGVDGRLGYGNTSNVGDAQTPGSVGAVDLGGTGITAVAISAGDSFTCAILDTRQVECWGYGVDGSLGYGNTSNVGDQNPPASAGTVDLGPGRTAVAISAGGRHTCAILDNGQVECWGYGGYGRLGYGGTTDVGNTPTSTPNVAGPVNLGPGRTAVAISAGANHTCALLDNDTVRCWGDGADGRLGYCSTDTIGATPTTTPDTAGPVNLVSGDGGVTCPAVPAQMPTAPAPPLAIATSLPATPSSGAPTNYALAALRAQALRARGLRACLTRAAHRPRHLRARLRAACVKRFARTPGGVIGLRARALGRRKIALAFNAPGTDGFGPPPAHGYLIKESLKPIRTAHDFSRAQTLCRGDCLFNVVNVGEVLKLTVTGLRPHTSYYYAIAARDNVTRKLGPRSRSVKASTPRG